MFAKTIGSIASWFFRTGRIFLICGIGTLGLFPQSSYSDSPAYDDSSVKSLWQTGKFAAVVDLLKSNPRPELADWNFDLGVAYLNTQNVAKAFAYLSRAERLNSGDRTIRAAWADARSRLLSSRDLQSPAQLDPGAYWYERISDQTGLDEIRAIFGAVGIFFVFMFVRQYRKTPRIRRSLLNPAFGFLGAALIANLGIYASQVYFSPRAAAVVLDTSALRAGPSKDHAEIGQVPAGNLVRLLGSAIGETGPTEVVNSVLGADADSRLGARLAVKPAWREVRVAKDKSGWVLDSALLAL